MNLSISGTYSVGKTITSMAISHLTGIPRTAAPTMRELLPLSLPGKTLEECNGAELIMLITRRIQGRAVAESHLPGGYISDGSALHEWSYANVRVKVGINPNESVDLDNVEMPDDVRFYAEVMKQIAIPAKQHTKSNYDAFVHLPIEFPIVEDGHRPVNERFRQLAEQLLLETLDELEIPVHIVGGTIPQRLARIVEIFDFPQVMTIEQAIARAEEEYAQLDTRGELERLADTAA
ncbi:AAA family ATPase [Streptomyces sp. NPDC002795]|uniref:AAA family ATPase n=1 Tax=Streptomyces sp. NPDC002795 TaxID=3364665 RepID=UPI0036C0C653